MSDLFGTTIPDPENTAQQGEPSAEPQQTPDVDVNALLADQLASIKNEEGNQKYSTVDDALKGASNAQEHISRLEAELKEARADSEKSATMQDIMNSIKGEATADDPQQNQLNEDDIGSMFEQLLTKHKHQEAAAANETAFSNKVTELYGEKAKEVLGGKAKELGIGMDILQDMARRSPQAALQLVGATSGGNLGNRPSSTVNTVSQPNNPDAPERTFSMAGGTTKDLMSEWQRIKSKVNSNK